jgi:hypothetical protein
VVDHHRRDPPCVSSRAARALGSNSTSPFNHR